MVFGMPVLTLLFCVATILMWLGLYAIEDRVKLIKKTTLLEAKNEVLDNDFTGDDIPGYSILDDDL